MRMFYEIFMR